MRKGQPEADDCAICRDRDRDRRDKERRHNSKSRERQRRSKSRDRRDSNNHLHQDIDREDAANHRAKRSRHDKDEVISLLCPLSKSALGHQKAG